MANFIYGILTGFFGAGLVFLTMNIFRASKVDEIEERIRKEYEEKAAKLKTAEQKLRRAVKR